MRVVVTGGAGFIGANLVHALYSHPDFEELRVLDDLSTGSKTNLIGLDVAFYEGTVLDPDQLDEVCAETDAIVHLAARPSVPRSMEDPAATHAANATGTLEVLQAARRAGNLYTIIASSSSVYGANPTLPKSEDLRPQPLSPYGVSKLAAESYALAYSACFDLPVLAFRLFNVFGPLQSARHAYAAAIPAFLDAALTGRPLQINGDGHQTRDFTFVTSVCAVIIDALCRRVTSVEPINLAFGTQWSLLAVIDTLEAILDRTLECSHGPQRAGDVRNSQADQTRLRALFPDIAPVSLSDGLRQTAQWAAMVYSEQSPSHPARG